MFTTTRVPYRRPSAEGYDVTGADRIDPDPMARPLHGERARQVNQPGFRRVVGGNLADRAQTQDRSYIDDATRSFLGDPTPCSALCDQPGAAEVGVDNGVPILLR